MSEEKPVLDITRKSSNHIDRKNALNCIVCPYCKDQGIVYVSVSPSCYHKHLLKDHNIVSSVKFYSFMRNKKKRGKEKKRKK